MKRFVINAKSVRVHIEEKGHLIVGGCYISSAVFFQGHSAVLMGVGYGIAALMTTHVVLARKARANAEKSEDK